MSDEPVQMPVAAVRAHAATVVALADEVELGHSAAAHVHLDRNSYGRLCQWLPDLFDPLAANTVAALDDCGRGMKVTGDGLRAAAQLAEASDSGAASRIAAVYSETADHVRPAYPGVELPL